MAKFRGADLHSDHLGIPHATNKSTYELKQLVEVQRKVPNAKTEGRKFDNMKLNLYVPNPEGLNFKRRLNHCSRL
jgi:hypothetical protein